MHIYHNKANLRDLIAATGLVILLKLDLNRWFFCPCDLEIWWMTPKNNRAPLLCHFKLFASFRSHWWIQTGVIVRKRLIWVKIDAFLSRVNLKFDGWPSTRQIWGIWKLRPAYSPETPNLGQKRWCFVACDLEIWWMTLENKRAPLLCYFKLYASFRSHRWIQAGVTVQKRPIWVKIDDLLSRVTLQFDVWPWKTIGHLFYATSSFVHHFVAIGDFKLELQSGNAQFGSNSSILQPCDLAIWGMTLKNNRAPLLFYFKLCASFRNHWGIETWVTVWKRPI